MYVDGISICYFNQTDGNQTLYLLESINELAQRLVCSVSNPVPSKAAHVVVGGFCAQLLATSTSCECEGRNGVLVYSLSFTILYEAMRSSSLSRTDRSDSETLPTTVWQVDSSFARSSAC